MKAFFAFGFIFYFQSSLASYSFGPSCTKIGKKCYTLSTTATTHATAINYCTEVGGRLAILEEDDVWVEINTILKFKSLGNHIWLRPTALSQTVTFAENDVIFPKSSSFWRDDRLAGTSYRCTYVGYSDGQVYMSTSCNSNYRFLCEISVDCNITEVEIPNADFDLCHSSTFIASETHINVSCWHGYILVGPKTITCDRKGNWSETPSCIPACETSPPDRDHALLATPLKPFYDLHERAVFICEENYYTWERNVLKSHFTVVCEKGGFWSNEEEDCIYSPETPIVRFKNKEKILLECDTEDGEANRWMMNDEFIKSDKKFQILKSGNLEIHSIKESDEGIYYCLVRRNKAVEIRKIFHVKQNKGCNATTESIVSYKHEVNENSAIVLSCNLRDGDSRWIKGNNTVKNDDSINNLPHGALLLKNVQLKDSGTYSCYCEKFKTAEHEIQVLASAKSICGKTRHSSLVTLWQSDDLAPFCYGTLINDQWVITSAFCLFNFRHMRTPEIRVQFLGADLNGKRSAEVSRVKIHPLYRPRLQANDVGFIKLKQPVKFTIDVLPVCLEMIDLTAKYECQETIQHDIRTIGFGSLDSLREQENIPSEEQMVLDYTDACRKSANIVVTDDMLCAQSNATLFASDNGAPLVVQWGGRSHLIGIYNFGERAIGFGDYDYFIDVLHHNKWIRKIIG